MNILQTRFNRLISNESIITKTELQQSAFYKSKLRFFQPKPHLKLIYLSNILLKKNINKIIFAVWPKKHNKTIIIDLTPIWP